MSTYLKVDKVSKTYEGNRKPAVQGLAFSMKRGEVLALVGPSGSGKSTLLKLVAGLLAPDEGSIAFRGNELSNPNEQLIAGEKDIKTVFQDLKLMPNHTVEENVKYPLLLFENAYQKERTTALLEMCGLTEFKDKLPKELSGGQQQRLALAKTLAEEPELLLMDEPFSNLDPLVKKKLIKDIMAVVRKEGIGLIWVTHETEDALMVSDRIGFISEGKLVQLDSPFNIYHRPENLMIASFFGLINAFSAKEVKTFFPTTKLEITQGQIVGLRAEAIYDSPKDNGLELRGELREQYFLGHSYLVEIESKGKRISAFCRDEGTIGKSLSLFVEPRTLMIMGKC